METISQNAIIWLSVTCALLFVLPIIYIIFWKNKQKNHAKISWLLIGALGFTVSARVLELLVHMVCILSDNPISRFLNGNLLAFVLYGIFMAGIFEECGRYVIIRFFLKKNRTRENAVMYGIGHGGIEVWLITLSAIASYLVIAIMVNAQGIDGAAAAMGSTKEGFQAILPSIASFNVLSCFISVIERVFCMGIHISLTIVVYYGVVNHKNIYLLYAVLAHAAIDVFAALYQKGAVTMFLSEIWLAIGCVLLCIWAKKLYDSLEEGSY